MRAPILLIALPLLSAAAAAPRIVASSGQWAALRQDSTCEAATAGVRAATVERPQARASIAFDAAPAGRNGQFAVRLGSAVRPGSSVLLHAGGRAFLLSARGTVAWSRDPAQEAAIIAVFRLGGAMRVEARSAGGARIVERFDLAGAATAIDAAAACAAGLAKV